jgi:hypothetical protein
MKPVWMMLLLVALSGLAMANPGEVASQTVTVPELNPGYALSALTLLSGVLVVISSRRKR